MTLEKIIERLEKQESKHWSTFTKHNPEYHVTNYKTRIGKKNYTLAARQTWLEYEYISSGDVMTESYPNPNNISFRLTIDRSFPGGNEKVQYYSFIKKAEERIGRLFRRLKEEVKDYDKYADEKFREWWLRRMM